MNYPARKLDLIAMTSATHFADRHVNNAIALARAVQDDNDREKRIAENKCRCCYYLRAGRMAGAAMTSQPCAFCGTIQSFGSTATDALCPACAKEHSLCRECGGDREMRTLRRKWPTPAARGNEGAE